MGGKAIKPVWDAARFPVLAKHSSSTPSVWFEEGRNPWTDFLTEKHLLEIGESLECNDFATLDELGCEICNKFEDYIGVENERDTSKSPSERIKWINENVLNPAETLLASFKPENKRWHSSYLDGFVENVMYKGIYVFDERPCVEPFKKIAIKRRRNRKLANYKGTAQPIPRFELWAIELAEIVRLAEDSIDEIRSHFDRRYKIKTVLDFDFVSDMLHVFTCVFPEKKIIAKDYDTEGETEIVKFIRDVYAIFSGERIPLTQQIKAAIKKFNLAPKIKLE